jgi:hypothetical protein
MRSETMGKTLSAYFKLNRRYFRSINLERDVEKLDAVLGYVLTERSTDALRRIVSAFGKPRTQCAWMITGSYGMGKSAFAHYLSCLCAPEHTPMRQEALAIAERSFGVDSPEVAALVDDLPKEDVLRAIATGQREPLSWTIVRALARGAEIFWQGRRKPGLLHELTDWAIEVELGEADITNQQVLNLLKDLIITAKSNLFLIVDELGKNLEFAAQHQGIEDLYLLQQIAELRPKGKYQIYFLGLLHQSFAGYSERLAAVEQSEWSKIQGRFEDIRFVESSSQMTRLIGQVIDRGDANPILYLIHTQAKAWYSALQSFLAEEVSEKVIAEAYPLHPITAIVLPLLCSRYAQNDRSLFTFLTSNEPCAFTQFLNTETVQGDTISTLKLHQIYDYFVESVSGLASRIHLQRWIEVQSLVQDVTDQSLEIQKIIKTIGILNLVTSAGTLRATPQIVALALCNTPNDKKEQKRWQQLLKDLQQRGLIVYRKQLDELRIWEGSDFNVEAAITEAQEKSSKSLAELLAATRPLKPTVAQRHYAVTGNLRYFEQRYVDSLSKLAEIQCSSRSYDGLIAYWVDTEVSQALPSSTADGKPLIVVSTDRLELLRIRSQEFQALRMIQKTVPELQKDGVARKEIKHRLVEAERLLDETLSQVFDWSEGQNSCWVEGEQVEIQNARTFQAMLSDLCDRTYDQGLILDNELINRRELTSQGAKARRELIEAMLDCSEQERLGLQGYGPEVSMYFSVLRETKIHRSQAGVWGFYPPKQGAIKVWKAIKQFCLEATEQPVSIQQLYQRLEATPYGVKAGIIPVLLAAVLLHYADEVSVYRDGSFVPVLGGEHFELLVKDPSRFSVKHIAVAGLRSQVFRELEAILRSSPVQGRQGSRNLTVLSVVKPLVQFVRKLPAYTLKTKRISAEAQAVIRVLRQTQEPDELLFTALPQACSFKPIAVRSRTDAQTARQFREKLVEALREIHTAYDRLLSDCQAMLYTAFGLRSDRQQIRQDLQFRAKYLLGSCLESGLDRFVRAAVNEATTEATWLEALLMIVADKPAEVWTDMDMTGFELKLSDLARRFKNLEALQKEVASGGSGFEARRITVTRPDGSEVHRMVWADHEQQRQVDPAIDQLLAEFGDRQTQEALLTRLAERLFGEVERLAQGSVSSEPIDRLGSR